ncbi:COP23 domain-containing protein [Crocosphaera sp.]|uniref:COP23 domain-containing protein n=1 Tax=Crocosphaera sp. TaxID=2729996 RepID=UPI00263194A9|nr:COP23 domain-containing protein [Crocosphaera sp.]MDJ0578704.1 COP23 domain-containing protein [Crocosphaera sp.]
MQYKTVITSVATVLTANLVTIVLPLSARENIVNNSSINRMLLTQNSDQGEFVCKEGYDKRTNQDQPTTYFWTPEGKRGVIRWVKAWGNSEQWTPQTRCETVSKKFQEAYKNGSLQKYITHGVENNQPVVCTAYEKGGKCVTTLMTLRPEDDPIEMAKKVSNGLKGRGGGIIHHSSEGKSQQYYKINFDRFLRLTPVE